MSSPVSGFNEIENLSRITTMVGLLRYRASIQPEKIGFTFLHNGEQASGSLTYRELDWQARTIAVWLTKHGGYGQRVVLIQKAGLDFLAAYMGCLYAGATPVPLVPPHLSHKHLSMEIFQRVVADCEARFLFADPLILHQREKVEAEFGVHVAEWTSVEQVLANQEAARDWRDPDPSGTDTVHLQYTSGSTERPKGIKITHSNLISNLKNSVFAYTSDNVSVSGLPHFHIWV